MEQVANQGCLRGSLVQLPEFSHESNGKSFYRFLLEVPRLSGAVDTLPIIVRDTVLQQVDLSGGEMLTIEGQVRSHNLRTEERRKLLIFLFANAITAEDGEPINQIQLQGNLCREPVYRRTPLGREICDVMLAVPRAFHRADYIPVILWGSTARQVAQMHTGQTLQVSGRMQSRIYTKLTPLGAKELTAYEISALSAEES